MKKISVLLSLFLINLSSGVIAQTEKISAREMIDKSQDLTRLDGVEMISTLKIIDQKGRERIRKIAIATLHKDGTDKTIMKFLEPADVRGTGILIFDYENKNDDMWIYLPALRKTRRLVSSDRSKRFMGSEFSNGDMSIPNLDDFQFKKIGSATIDEIECYKIESLPISKDIADDNGFSKKVVYIEKASLYARRVDYYDLDGKLHKELLISDYDLIDEENNKSIARYLEIENKQNDRKSIMKLEKVMLNYQLANDLFTTHNLEK